MNTLHHPFSSGRLTAILFLLAAAALPRAAAQNVTLSFINNSGDDVYITFNNTFSEAAYDISYTNTLSQAITVNRNSNGFSDSIPLTSVQGANFSINSIVSGGFYVSYGSGLSGIAPSPVATSDAAFNTRYFQVETTIFNPGNASNNGDYTAVNLFSGSGNIINYYSNGTANMNVGFGTTSSSTLFNQLHSALSTSGELGTNTTVAGNVQASVIVNSSNNQFIRVLSPSNWGNISGNYSVGPYHSFGNYAQSMQTSNGGGVQNTTLKYVFQTGSTTFNGNSSYTGGLRYEAEFIATPANVTVGNATGASFSLSGNIAVSALPHGNITNITPLGVVSGLAATLPIDTADSKELSYLIYAQPGDFTTNTIFNAGNWTVGGIDSSDANLAQQFILGDLQEGMLTGFVGSDVVFNGNNSSLDPSSLYFGMAAENIPSEVWWSNYTGQMYSTLQPGGDPTDPYYSVYSSVIFPAGNTYSAPYDDRFQATHNPDIAINATWVMTLNPTGDIVVPEPGATAAIAACLALAAAACLRRRATGATADRSRSAPPG